MTAWRVAAWSHPQDPGGFWQRTHAIEFIRFTCNDPEEPRGRCQLTVSADYPWQELIQAQDPTSPVNTSLLRLYPAGVGGDGIPDAEYKLTRFSKRITDDGMAVVDLFGIDWRIASLDPAALRWFDWFPGATRSVDPDWSFGMGNDLLNGDGGFETDSFPNAGFEDGNANHWSTPEGGSISVVEDPVQAHGGDYYGLWNPGGQGTILRRTIPSVKIGSDFTVTGWLDDLDGTGERIRIGISGATGASHTNAYEEDGIWWAELGNATQGNGSTDGTWQQTTLSFTAGEQPVELVIEYQGTLDHNIAVDDFAVTTGAEFDVGSWVTGGHPATMNIAEISTEEAHSGTRSLKLQGSQSVYTDAFGRTSYIHVRAQYEDEVRLTPGRIYTAEAWIKHTGASNENFLIWASRTSPQGPLAQTVEGGLLPAPGSYWMASATVNIAPNTWTRLRWTQIADTKGVRLGVAWHGGTTDVGTQASPTFYVDDYALVEGLPAATIGDMSDRIMDNAQIDHPSVAKMPYITGRTYTDTVDSAGVNWPQEESVRLRRGQKYGTHIYGGTFRQLGYDHDVTPNTTDPTQPEWDLHIWGAGNRGSVLDRAFYVGMGAAGGLVAGTLPQATRILAEGADGIITEIADAAQEAETGIYEEWLGDTDITDLPTLQTRAQTRLAEQTANALAINIELDDSAPTPWRDFDVGDRAQFGWAGTTTKHERTISEIALSAEADANGEILWTASITASRLLQGDAATKEALYRLLSAYRPMPEKGGGGAISSDVGGGKAPTFVIAAANAPAFEKEAAHFTCAGSNDELVIQTAIDIMNLETSGLGRILLTSGRFTFGAGGNISGALHLAGMGINQTVIDANPGAGVTAIILLQGEASGFTINVTGGNGIAANAGFGTHIRDVAIFPDGVGITASANRTLISNCWVGGGTDCIVIDGGDRTIIDGCNLETFAGTGIVGAVQAHTMQISDTRINARHHGITLAGDDAHIRGVTIDEPGLATANTYDAIQLTGNRATVDAVKIITGGATPRHALNLAGTGHRIGSVDFGAIAAYGSHPINDTATDTRWATARTATFREPGPLVAASIAARWPISDPGILLDVHAMVDTAPSGGPVTLDVNKNGATTFATATQPAIADGANDSGKTIPDPTLLAIGDYLGVDVDAANGAEDMIANIRYIPV